MNVMLAKRFEGQNVDGWLISEKLDGVRAIWTGTELRSRNGNKFHAPDWFTAQLPVGIVLDGELYISRGTFQKVVGIVRKKSPIDAEWQMVRYCVFDAPECRGGFEARLKFCSEILTGCAIAEVVNYEVCSSTAHLNEVFSSLIAQGAEGVMLRRSGSAYEHGHSDSLLKYKALESDEAEIVGYQPGEGKYSGMLGALVCSWRGTLVELGTGFSDALRSMPPKIGAKVTFEFSGLTNKGIPFQPVFVTERNYE